MLTSNVKKMVVKGVSSLTQFPPFITMVDESLDDEIQDHNKNLTLLYIGDWIRIKYVIYPF